MALGLWKGYDECLQIKFKLTLHCECCDGDVIISDIQILFSNIWIQIFSLLTIVYYLFSSFQPLKTVLIVI